MAAAAKAVASDLGGMLIEWEPEQHPAWSGGIRWWHDCRLQMGLRGCDRAFVSMHLKCIKPEPEIYAILARKTGGTPGRLVQAAQLTKPEAAGVGTAVRTKIT